VYAIIEDSGTQIKVQAGDIVDLDLRDLPEGGGSLTFDKVLAIGDGNAAARIGMPYLKGATVKATVVGDATGPKIRGVKYTRRKGSLKSFGHRQDYIRVKIDSIEG
jgi:large subunit ribosomal protein L21